MSRAARILAMLEDARYVPVDELAEALGVSRRTVAAEVNALQDLGDMQLAAATTSS